MFAFLLTFALTATAPEVSDVLPVTEEYSIGYEDTVSSGDAVGSPSVDVAVLADTLESIDEKLAVMSVEASVNAHQVSDYYREYFKGILQNMPYTEYLCYAERIYINNYSTITHYYLFYDLKLSGGEVVPGTYPCLDVYNSDGVYYMKQIDKVFAGYPTMGYASFAPYSALIDRSFDYNALYVGLICVLVFFLLGRKTVFS